MATPFLSSEEYDERAHRYYDDGNYDAALDTLKEGLRLYPHSVELYVGIGYTRLAREEFIWAKQAFERALVLDPEHEDGLVGMGETLLRFGGRDEAMRLFTRAQEAGSATDLELLLTMGRALYRERLYDAARSVLARSVELYPNSAEAAAAFGYTLHRLDDEIAARRQLRRALHLDTEYHEARIYLGHLLYDRGDWVGAAREFERVPPAEHWDALAIWRLIELRRSLESLDVGAPELAVWERRLDEVEGAVDPIDEMLAEIEAGQTESAPDHAVDGSAADESGAGAMAADTGDGLDGAGGPARRDDSDAPNSVDAERPAADVDPHRVSLPEGLVAVGTWADIVEQLRQACAPGETIAQFMRRTADEAQARAGVTVLSEDARSIVLAGARAGFWEIEY